MGPKGSPGPPGHKGDIGDIVRRNGMRYVLIKAPLRVGYVNYCMRGSRDQENVAQGKVECYIFVETVPSAIIPVTYESTVL